MSNLVRSAIALHSLRKRRWNDDEIEMAREAIDQAEHRAAAMREELDEYEKLIGEAKAALLAPQRANVPSGSGSLERFAPAGAAEEVGSATSKTVFEEVVCSK